MTSFESTSYQLQLMGEKKGNTSFCLATAGLVVCIINLGGSYSYPSDQPASQPASENWRSVLAMRATSPIADSLRRPARDPPDQIGHMSDTMLLDGNTIDARRAIEFLCREEREIKMVGGGTVDPCWEVDSPRVEPSWAIAVRHGTEFPG